MYGSGKLLTRSDRGPQVCRKGLPATCSGTLIAPNLVLSARHCLDTPAALNGTLERVVFAADMFSDSAVSRPVEKVLSTRYMSTQRQASPPATPSRAAGTCAAAPAAAAAAVTATGEAGTPAAAALPALYIEPPPHPPPGTTASRRRAAAI